MADSKYDSSLWINYRKSIGYRGIHVDGCSIDITPQGLFHINFWSERFAIPKAINFELDTSKGKLGDAIEISDDSISGYIREVDFGAFIDLNTLVSIKELIEEKIKQHKDAIKSE